MIIDLRGTHGSGKSYVGRALIERYSMYKIKTHNMRYRDYIGYGNEEHSVGLVGRPSCDQIQPVEEIEKAVRLFDSVFSVVFFEGILVSHTYSRYAKLASELKDYTFCFLDTPLSVCIQRVEARRKEKGNLNPFDPKNVIKDHRQIYQSVRGKCIANGMNVVHVDYRFAAGTVISMVDAALLVSAGELGSSTGKN